MPQRSELQQPAQYPLLTALSDHGVTEQPVSRMPASCRSVPIRYLSATAQVDDAALHAASSGQCVAWIHNTVAAAQASFQRLQQRIADSGAQIELVLFHARFALCDRLRIEDRILAGFGPESVATGRQQRIVIATQVIEQSLDLDFDLLISELAPIDLLLQRFGRWRRHPRDAAGNRIEGVDQRTPDAVIVHGPERIADPPGNWLRAWSAGTAMVYANHGQMYLSAKALGAGVELPQQQRELIEAVYGEAASETIPAELAKASEQAEGEQMAQQSVAAINVIDFANGYQRDRNAWPDDLRAQTRLGEPNIDVALARCTASGIEPWAAADPHDPSDYLRWAMSVVKVRADQLCARAPLSDPVLEAAAVLLETESPFLRWRVLLPLIQQPDGRWRAAGLRQLRQNAPSSVLYDYSADSGLVRIKGEA
jgi:CRISPR-associated endonuclease/helicase Cas3